ncbi:MAG: hypothetical protein RJQ21_12120 [Rhodospirillales bacterium]
MDHLIGIAARHGFSAINQTSKVICFASENGSIFYLIKDQIRGGSIAIAVNPQVEPETIQEFGGNPEVDETFLHNSNFRKFPKRQHRGINPIGYGRRTRFRNSLDFSNFLLNYNQPG